MKVPGSEDKKADVKNLAGKNRPVNSKIHDIFKGWSFQPLDPGTFIKSKKYTFTRGPLGFIMEGRRERGDRRGDVVQFKVSQI